MQFTITDKIKQLEIEDIKEQNLSADDFYDKVNSILENSKEDFINDLKEEQKDLNEIKIIRFILLNSKFVWKSLRI